VRGEGNSLND